jgi:hypothetical protein
VNDSTEEAILATEIDCFIVTDVDVRCLVNYEWPDAWYVSLNALSARFSHMKIHDMEAALCTPGSEWYLTNCRALAEAIQVAGARWQWHDEQQKGARTYGR